MGKQCRARSDSSQIALFAIPPNFCLKQCSCFSACRKKSSLFPKTYIHWHCRSLIYILLLFFHINIMFVHLTSSIYAAHENPYSNMMDGWMTCNFRTFSTLFQSYQDDGWMIMKGCVQWNPVYGREDFTSSEDPAQDR